MCQKGGGEEGQVRAVGVKSGVDGRNVTLHNILTYEVGLEAW